MWNSETRLASNAEAGSAMPNASPKKARSPQNSGPQERQPLGTASLTLANMIWLQINLRDSTLEAKAKMTRRGEMARHADLQYGLFRNCTLERAPLRLLRISCFEATARLGMKGSGQLPFTYVQMQCRVSGLGVGVCEAQTTTAGALAMTECIMGAAPRPSVMPGGMYTSAIEPQPLSLKPAIL